MEEKKLNKLTVRRYHEVYLRHFSPADLQKISDVQGIIADTFLQLKHLKTQNELFLDRLDDETREVFEKECKATEEAYNGITAFQLCFAPPFYY